MGAFCLGHLAICCSKYSLNCEKRGASPHTLLPYPNRENVREMCFADGTPSHMVLVDSHVRSPDLAQPRQSPPPAVQESWAAQGNSFWDKHLGVLNSKQEKDRLKECIYMFQAVDPPPPPPPNPPPPLWGWGGWVVGWWWGCGVVVG